MKDIGVPDHESGKDPITPVDEIVVVHVIPQVFQSKSAVVVVGVHSPRDKLANVTI